MSAGSSPQPDPSQPPIRRLKLFVSTPEKHQVSQRSAHPTQDGPQEQSSKSSSPTRPSYSPVTPTLSHSSANGQSTTEPEWIDEPEPLPVSLDENPDAIALQATISLLQMQRQQSLRDIRGLNRIKQEALEQPEAFVADLRHGKLSKPAPVGVSLDSDGDGSDEENTPQTQQRSQFGVLPTPQNIARCPPIEWSKYRIAGEPLDRLHELQRRYPGVTEEMLVRNVKPQQHEVIAPYSPFTDKLDPLPPSGDTKNYDR